MTWYGIIKKHKYIPKFQYRDFIKFVMCKDLGVIDNKYHYKVDFIIDTSRQKKSKIKW